MTVKSAKQAIVDTLQALREDGIIVQEIIVGWVAEVTPDRAKPEAQMKCHVTFKADL